MNILNRLNLSLRQKLLILLGLVCLLLPFLIVFPAGSPNQFLFQMTCLMAAIAFFVLSDVVEDTEDDRG